ncbi:hypothetical protein I3760_14G127700 [Carya illinoinensis]|nr:hypothetical protein I3760_14G127700 [Carya illinoinensis]
MGTRVPDNSSEYGLGQLVPPLHHLPIWYYCTVRYLLQLRHLGISRKPSFPWIKMKRGGWCRFGPPSSLFPFVLIRPYFLGPWGGWKSPYKLNGINLAELILLVVCIMIFLDHFLANFMKALKRTAVITMARLVGTFVDLNSGVQGCVCYFFFGHCWSI